jgi:hypothetical protein
VRSQSFKFIPVFVRKQQAGIHRHDEERCERRPTYDGIEDKMCLSSMWKEFRDKLFRDVSYSAHTTSLETIVQMLQFLGDSRSRRNGMLWGQNISEQWLRDGFKNWRLKD